MIQTPIVRELVWNSKWWDQVNSQIWPKTMTKYPWPFRFFFGGKQGDVVDYTGTKEMIFGYYCSPFIRPKFGKLHEATCVVSSFCYYLQKLFYSESLKYLEFQEHQKFFSTYFLHQEVVKCSWKYLRNICNKISTK